MRFKATVSFRWCTCSVSRGCSCETEGGALEGLIATPVPESGEIAIGFCVRRDAALALLLVL